MDAFCHVVRAFEDEAVFHASGSVDPLRDIEVMNLELAITDLSLVDLRLERIAQEQKKKADSSERRRGGAAADAEALSGKRQIVARAPHAGSRAEEDSIASVPDAEEHGDGAQLRRVEFSEPAACWRQRRPESPALATRSARFPPKSSPKSHRLEIPRERAEFLQALGIEEPAVNVLTRLLYKALGYICFFTVGEDEVRAWTIRRGGTAVDAAGAIHSDLARGFIRAEVMKCDELLAAGAERGSGHAAEVHLKETAKLHLKGKDYIVEDGDIVHVRHSGSTFNIP